MVIVWLTLYHKMTCALLILGCFETVLYVTPLATQWGQVCPSTSRRKTCIYHKKKSLLEMNGWGWDLTMVMARPFLCCRTAPGSLLWNCSCCDPSSGGYFFFLYI